MKRITVLDNAAGNAVGWDPNNVDTSFIIFEPDISGNVNSPFFIVELTGPGGQEIANTSCTAAGHDINDNTFSVTCNNPVFFGYELHYVVGNLPAHTVV